MSNIKLAPGMEIETATVDLHDIEAGDHVVVDDLIYEITKGYPATKGQPVWQRSEDKPVTGRQVDVSRVGGEFQDPIRVITLVR